MQEVTTRRRKLAAVCFAGCISLCLFQRRLHAAEGGITAYAPGSFASFIDALAPKPGFALFNYFAFYNGSADASHSFPIAGQIGVKVEATTYANSVGGFWITPLEFLRGHYAVGVSIPIT